MCVPCWAAPSKNTSAWALTKNLFKTQLWWNDFWEIKRWLSLTTPYACKSKKTCHFVREGGVKCGVGAQDNHSCLVVSAFAMDRAQGCFHSHTHICMPNKLRRASCLAGRVSFIWLQISFSVCLVWSETCTLGSGNHVFRWCVNAQYFFTSFQKKEWYKRTPATARYIQAQPKSAIWRIRSVARSKCK